MNKVALRSRYSSINHQQQNDVLNDTINKTIMEQSVEESKASLVNIASQIYSSPFFNTRNKHIKIKLQMWMQILQKNEYNSVWRKNKLNYLKLLNLMCQCECLIHPFTSFPRQDSLPILKKHEMDRIMDNIQKQIRSNTKRNTQSQLTSIKNRKSAHLNKSKHITDRENMYQHNTKRKDSNMPIQTQQNGGMIGQSIKKKQQGDTIGKSKFIQQRLKQEQQKNQTFNSSFLHIEQDPLTDQSNTKNENYSFMSNKKKNNSISDSISLQMSPVSVSSKVWEYTKKKERQSKRFTQTPDLSKMLKTTVYSLTKQGRQSHGGKQFQTPSIEWVTGKQYWQSSSFTGNATPNYISHFRNIPNMSINESQEVETFRTEDKRCCQCSCLF